MEKLICKSGDLRIKLRSVLLIAVALLFAALVFEALTLIGAPSASVFDLGAWGKKRILVVWVLLMAVYGACRYFGITSSLHAWVLGLYRERRIRVLGAVYKICGFVVTGLAAAIVVYALSLTGMFRLTVALSLFFFAVGGCVFLVYANRAKLALNPECVFVPIGIVMGILIAILTPVQTSVSFDDQIHYNYTLALSYLSSPEYTESDMILLSPPFVDPTDSDYWTFSEDEYREIINDFDSKADVLSLVPDGFSSATGGSTLQYSNIGYIPGALGLWLGRLLHLPFVAVFLLGRIANVLFFFTLVYFAVRHLKSQKILALAFALLPSILFIGSNYSYDIWVIGWLLFGFLRYLSWLQNPDEKLSAREVLVVIVSFILGLGPKAIYFPIFFLLLFIPKSKFPSRRFASRYRMAIVGAALLMLSTFLLPFVIQGPGIGDVRGGSDVNSTEQLLFVMEDPLRYAGILTNFLASYLSIGYSPSYTSVFAYLGTSTIGSLPLVSLILVAVTDSGTENFPYALWRYRSAGLALLLGTSILMASAFYVSFTAVGLNTVAGCQGRYLLPLLLPFLALFFNSRIQNENSRKWYNFAVLLLSMTFIVVSVFELNVGVYVG